MDTEFEVAVNAIKLKRKVEMYQWKENRGVALFKLNKKDAAQRDFKHAANLGHKNAKVILKKII